MTDTDGIIDRCKCGKRGNIVELPMRFGGVWRVECNSCGYSTGDCNGRSHATTKWNQRQRKAEV